jgi:hypothetical protein
MIRYFKDKRGIGSGMILYRADYTTKEVFVKYTNSDRFVKIETYDTIQFQQWRNTSAGMKLKVYNSEEEMILDML